VPLPHALTIEGRSVTCKRASIDESESHTCRAQISSFSSRLSRWHSTSGGQPQRWSAGHASPSGSQRAARVAWRTSPDHGRAVRAPRQRSTFTGLRPRTRRARQKPRVAVRQRPQCGARADKMERGRTTCEVSKAGSYRPVRAADAPSAPDAVRELIGRLASPPSTLITRQTPSSKLTSSSGSIL
jgi:hypothetical protein